MQAAAIRTSNLSPPGERLPQVYRDAVVQAVRDSLGDADADSYAATLDRIWIHWGSILTDTDVFGGIDIGLAIAQTFGYDVYLESARPDVAYNRSLSDTILHETVHTRQYESYGSSLSNFGYHYFKKWCQAGFDYADNALEADAFGFEAAYGAAVYNALWPETTVSIAGTGTQNDGQTQDVSWDISGRLDVVDVELQKHAGSWSRVDGDAVEYLLSPNQVHDVDGHFNFDSAGTGSFRLKVSTTQNQPDNSGTGSSATTEIKYYPSASGFSVGDDDSYGPSIVLGGVVGTITDATPRTFTWSETDPSGISSSSVTLTRSGVPLMTSSAASGSFDFTAQGPGSYTLQVTAIDNDQDRSGDTATSITSRSVIVTDDDTVAPRIDFAVGEGVPLIGTGFSESHGEFNAIHWNVSDTSGIDQVTANLWRDSTFIGSFQAGAQDQIVLDPYGLGTFRVDLSARDADTDGWVGDQLTATSSAYLTVTNAAPTVFAGGPYLVQEGRLLTLHSQGSDADLGDTETLIYEWDLDNDGQFDDAVGADPAITWDQLVTAGVADDGSYTVRVRVTDSFAAQAIANATVTVLNAPPQVEAIYSSPDIDENSDLTVTGAFTDPSPLDTHQVIVFWGDGTSSFATVDPGTRTFVGVHHYADDAPSGTSVDEYLLRVEVSDDDGGLNPPTIRTLTVETNRVGGIELPEFHASLPAGISGLLESAHVFADPLPVETTEAVAQAFNHQHVVDYPPSGGPFDLPATTTGSTSIAGNHTHSFDIPAITQTFTGSSLSTYFLQSSDQTISLDPRSTVLASGLPAGYEHEHTSGNVTFRTTTTFTYYPSSYQTIVSTEFGSTPSNITLNGNAYNAGDRIRLTDNVNNQLGSLVVETVNSPINDFIANFRAFLGSESSSVPADGLSFVFGPISQGSLFGEEGLGKGTGLSVTFDTYNNGCCPYGDGVSDVIGMTIFYNGSYYANITRSVGSIARDAYANFEVSVTPSGFLTVRHPALSGGVFTTTLSGWNPQSSWRFGLGARCGGANEFHTIDNLTIRAKYPLSYSVTKDAVNQYILPKFTGSGSLTQSVVTLDPLSANTTTVDGGQVLHDHEIGLEIPPFLFNVVNTSDGAATQNHDHQVDFAPIELDFSSDNDLRTYFLQAGNVVLNQPAVTTTMTLNHSHTLPASTIPFHAIATFTYDVSSLLVRVHNRNPESLSTQLPSSAIENSTVQLSGSFVDQGAGDTHRVVVGWGDGSSSDLSVPFGQRTFMADHEYVDDTPSGTVADNYTVTVSVVDDDSGTASILRTITLLNDLPSLSLALTGASNEGSSFAIQGAYFTDRGRLDTHTATINWGDGQSSSGVVTESGGSGVVNASHVFVDNGNFVVRVTVRDDDGGESVRNMTVSVANVAPSIDRLWTEGPALEGTGLTLRATVSDPGADVLTYAWDFGDGSAPASGVNLTSLNHVYANEGSYPITLVVDDGDGGSSTQAMTVVVANMSTAASMSGPAEVVEGATYTLTLSAFTSAAAAAISSWNVNWGDGGSTTYATDGSVSHVYADGPADHTIRVDVVKTVGGTSTLGTLPVHVLNASPRISSLTGNTTGLEGQSRQFNGSATDPGADSINYAWNFGDGSPVVSGPGLTSVQHTFADDGAYVVTLSVTDDDGATDSRQLTAVITNVVPTLAISGPAIVDEGAAYGLTLGTTIDSGTDVVTEWIVDWGDGRSDSYGSNGIVAHAFADGPGNHTIGVSLHDEDGVHRNVAQLAVSVADAAPQINAIVVDSNPLEGSVTNLSANVVDPAGPYDLLTYRWNFGDGSPIVQGLNLTSVRHTYADNGSFTVALQVSDEDGLSSTRTEIVAVADVAPITVLSGQPTATEGHAYEVTPGPIFDPGTDTVVQWIINWGDGTQDVQATSNTATHVYQDGTASYDVVLTLVDEDGQHLDRARLPVSVTNADPVITSLTGNTFGIEGDSFLFEATSHDDGADLLTYAWDFGDGTSIESGVGLRQASHVFADDGLYILTVAVDDSDGGADSASLLVEVQNAVPTILLTSPDTVPESQTFELSLGAIIDPGHDTVTEWLVDWGDGSNDNYATAGTVSHSFADGPANHLIHVSLVDEDGIHFDAGVRSVAITNEPPTIVLLTVPTDLQEGDLATFSGEATDPAGLLDTLTYRWNFGDGSNTVSGEALSSVAHAYADNGSYTVALTITDEDGGQATRQFPLEVSNVSPTIQLTGAPSTSEAVAYELTLGAVTDPGQDTVSEWIVNWGDGTQQTYATGGRVTHTYLDGPANQVISVLLVDEDGTHLAVENTVFVRNTPPQIDSLTGETSGDEGDELSFAAMASDVAGSADVLTYAWDFGDGTSPISGIDLTSVSHLFADNGDFAVQLTVSDDDGGSITEFIGAHLHNVAPDFEAGGNETIQPPALGAFSRSSIAITDISTLDTFSGTADFGDGSGPQAIQINQVSRRFDLVHTFPNTNAAPAILTYTVSVCVSDDDLGTHCDTFDVTVNLNTPPVAEDDSPSTDEDHLVTFDVLANDHDNQNNIVPSLTVTLSAPASGQLIDNGAGSMSFNPASAFEYLGVGELAQVSFGYQISDAFGETDAAIVTITVTGVNDAPTITRINADVTISEGQTASNSGSFGDVDLSDSVTIIPSIGTVTQDVGHGGAWSWSFATSDGPDENQIVTITADDGNGGVVTTSFELIVTNAAPTVTLMGEAVANEGSTKHYSFTVDDAGNDTFSVLSQSCGDHGILLNATFNSATGLGGFDCTFPDGPASSQVSIQVADSDDAPSNMATIDVTVANVEPEILSLSLSSASINEGQSVTASGMFRDSALGVASEAFTGTALWSDGVTTAVTIMGDGFSTTRSFPDDDPTGTPNDTFTVSVTILDDDTGSDSSLSPVLTVNNSAPVMGAIASPPAISVGTAAMFSVPFSDLGTPDSHMCMVTWGDSFSSVGTVRTGAVITVVADAASVGSDAGSIRHEATLVDAPVLSESAGVGACSASHVYAGSGPFTVSFAVTDDDGGVGTQSIGVNIARSVFALNPTICGALTLSGNAQISVQGNLTVASNCTVNAIAASGNASIAAARVESVGGVRTTGNATVSPVPIHIAGPVADPLASLASPSSGPLLGQVSCSGNSTQTINPGVYSRIQASGNCQLTMTSGVYVVAGGGFQVSGNAGVTGLQVAVYNAGSNFPNPGGNTASVQLSGNGSFNLTPPIAGPLSGLLFFQARDNTKPMSLSGNATGMLGTIYAPAAQLTLSGNGELKASLIVDTLRLSGNAVANLNSGGGAGDAEAAILAAGQLRTGVTWVSIQGEAGATTAEQLARIRDAIATINDTFGTYGVSLVEVDADADTFADIRIQVSTSSPCGSAADGILGCSTIFGDITFLSGWGWYAGADSAAVGAGQYDYQTIATHELGHAVGLEHSPSTNSAMYAALPTGVARRNFSAEDLAALADGVHNDSHENALAIALYAGIRSTGLPLSGGRRGGLHDRAETDIMPSPWQEPVRTSDAIDRVLDRRGITIARYPVGRGLDVLIGRAGDDLIVGDSGSDIMVGGYGSDLLVPRPVNNTMNLEIASAANDTVLETLFTDW